MRLTKTKAIAATEELLSILAENLLGIRTSDLRGTRFFHGSHTLSNRQIIRLLRATGKVSEHSGGQGVRTFSFWKLRT